MSAQKTRYGLTETRRGSCVPVTAARVFRAEAFADGLTNDDGNDGDGYNWGENGKERVAVDIMPNVAEEHSFFPFRHVRQLI